MAIKDKTRKILWARSGNKCSICRKDLVSQISSEGDFVIGEECHIISSQTNGPRHKPNISDYDINDNIILLCRNHHKEIDDNPITYSEDILQAIKTNHENWVKEKLGNTEAKEKIRFLTRITSGKELANILNGAYGSYKDYDDVTDLSDIEYLAGVFQELSDYIDIYGDLESYDQIKATFQLGNIIKDIEEHGFYLFADRHIEKWTFMDGLSNNCPVCTLVIKKQDNKEIIKFDLSNIKNQTT